MKFKTLKLGGKKLGELKDAYKKVSPQSAASQEWFSLNSQAFTHCVSFVNLTHCCPEAATDRLGTAVLYP